MSNQNQNTNLGPENTQFQQDYAHALEVMRDASEVALDEHAHQLGRLVVREAEEITNKESLGLTPEAVIKSAETITAIDAHGLTPESVVKEAERFTAYEAEVTAQGEGITEEEREEVADFEAEFRDLLDPDRNDKSIDPDSVKQFSATNEAQLRKAELYEASKEDLPPEEIDHNGLEEE